MLPGAALPASLCFSGPVPFPRWSGQLGRVAFWLLLGCFALGWVDLILMLQEPSSEGLHPSGSHLEQNGQHCFEGAGCSSEVGGV